MDKKLLGTRDAYGEVLQEIGKDPRVVALDADLAGSTRSLVFGKKYKDRFFNMGISEQDLMGTSAGLASEGFIVFASTFAIFATGRPWEQIRQSIAYNKFNVKIVASHGGITVGPDGASHQSTEDIGLMRIIPEMRVLIPSDYYQAREMIYHAYENKGPYYIRTSREKYPVIYDSSYKFELGKPEILREGQDIAILSTGFMVHNALNAYDRLIKNTDYKPYIINIPTIKPLDHTLILDISRKVKALITVEEHSTIGGLYSAITEAISPVYPLPVHAMGIKDRFGESGSPEDLFALFNLMPEDIAKKVIEVME